VRQRQQGPEVELTPQSVLLHTNAEPGVLTADGHAHCLSVFVERNHLLDRVRDAEDLIGRHIDVDPLILRYLRRYLEHLIAGKDEAVHPLVADQIGTTLLDLVALTLANGRDGPLSHSRGIRGARLQEVLVSITSNFDNAGFSPSQLAAKLGLTQRYIQDLLYETGRTFSERVMELRLQKARVMLGDPRHDKLKISDIAYACGFNEVSYFNRCFRRRFGASPSHYRDRGQG
jgi:AraC-like DNA-binding protein